MRTRLEGLVQGLRHRSYRTVPDRFAVESDIEVVEPGKGESAVYLGIGTIVDRDPVERDLEIFDGDIRSRAVRRQRLEADKRNIFERYIPDVAEALSNLAGASEDRLLGNLQALARERTAEADVELDEDGNPIEKQAEREPVDDSTLIVPENKSLDAPTELFTNGANGVKKNGRKRGKRTISPATRRRSGRWW